jgi:TRAP-type uncharacterized transport system fused permease subunit
MNITTIFKALNEGGHTILSVGIACVTCGIVVGVVAITGVGQVIAYNIVSLSHNILIIALLFSMLASIFLSMGLPATACYIIVATICAPALMRMGVAPLVAHFFVFFFGCLSNLTPPVALASYTAAGIAGAEPSKVAWTGLRLTFASFILPYIFVFSPQLLLQGVKFPDLLILLLTTFLAIFCFAIAERGYWKVTLRIFERIMLLGVSIILIVPERLTDIIGILTFIAVMVAINKRIRKINN